MEAVDPAEFMRLLVFSLGGFVIALAMLETGDYLRRYYRSGANRLLYMALQRVALIVAVVFVQVELIHRLDMHDLTYRLPLATTFYAIALLSLVLLMVDDNRARRGELDDRVDERRTTTP